jgi:four helix bundle protein
MKDKRDPLREKSLSFAIRVVNLYKYLKSVKHEDVISRQLLKAGTNPGAMIREAANAESGADFIHKLSIAQKEIDESQYWLELLLKTDYLTQKEFESLIADSEEILKILKSSIITKKRNIKK